MSGNWRIARQSSFIRECVASKCRSIPLVPANSFQQLIHSGVFRMVSKGSGVSPAMLRPREISGNSKKISSNVPFSGSNCPTNSCAHRIEDHNEYFLLSSSATAIDPVMCIRKRLDSVDDDHIDPKRRAHRVAQGVDELNITSKLPFDSFVHCQFVTTAMNVPDLYCIADAKTSRSLELFYVRQKVHSAFIGVVASTWVS